MIYEKNIIEKTFSYLTSPDYLSWVMTNTYGIGYNPPGIEIVCFRNFEDLFGEIRHKFLGNDFEVSILTEQFLSTLDDKQK